MDMVDVDIVDVNTLYWSRSIVSKHMHTLQWGYLLCNRYTVKFLGAFHAVCLQARSRQSGDRLQRYVGTFLCTSRVPSLGLC